MKHPSHIMPAIHLLQNAKEKRRVPRWFVFLDYALGILVFTLWYGLICFSLFKIWTWLK
jgi:hypothetical protein